MRRQEACVHASCDGITWNGIKTGSNKPKVKEPFFILLVHSVSRRLSVFTTFIRSEDKGLLGFRGPVDLVSFAPLLSS